MTAIKFEDKIYKNLKILINVLFSLIQNFTMFIFINYDFTVIKDRIIIDSLFY